MGFAGLRTRVVGKMQTVCVSMFVSVCISLSLFPFSLLPLSVCLCPAENALFLSKRRQSFQKHGDHSLIKVIPSWKLWVEIRGLREARGVGDGSGEALSSVHMIVCEATDTANVKQRERERRKRRRKREKEREREKRGGEGKKNSLGEGIRGEAKGWK